MHHRGMPYTCKCHPVESILRNSWLLSTICTKLCPDAPTACPLYRAEQKGENLTSTAEWEEACQTIKRHLSNALILTVPRVDVPFILDTDASESGLWAMLSQIQDRQERVISFAAFQSKAERN